MEITKREKSYYNEAFSTLTGAKLLQELPFEDTGALKPELNVDEYIEPLFFRLGSQEFTSSIPMDKSSVMFCGNINTDSGLIYGFSVGMALMSLYVSNYNKKSGEAIRDSIEAFLIDDGNGQPRIKEFSEREYLSFIRFAKAIEQRGSFLPYESWSRFIGNIDDLNAKLSNPYTTINEYNNKDNKSIVYAVKREDGTVHISSKVRQRFDVNQLSLFDDDQNELVERRLQQQNDNLDMFDDNDNDMANLITQSIEAKQNNQVNPSPSSEPEQADDWLNAALDEAAQRVNEQKNQIEPVEIESIENRSNETKLEVTEPQEVTEPVDNKVEIDANTVSDDEIREIASNIQEAVSEITPENSTINIQENYSPPSEGQSFNEVEQISEPKQDTQEFSAPNNAQFDEVKQKNINEGENNSFEAIAYQLLATIDTPEFQLLDEKINKLKEQYKDDDSTQHIEAIGNAVKWKADPELKGFAKTIPVQELLDNQYNVYYNMLLDNNRANLTALKKVDNEKVLNQFRENFINTGALDLYLDRNPVASTDDFNNSFSAKINTSGKTSLKLLGQIASAINSTDTVDKIINHLNTVNLNNYRQQDETERLMNVISSNQIQTVGNSSFNIGQYFTDKLTDNIIDLANSNDNQDFAVKIMYMAVSGACSNMNKESMSIAGDLLRSMQTLADTKQIPQEAVNSTYQQVGKVLSGKQLATVMTLDEVKHYNVNLNRNKKAEMERTIKQENKQQKQHGPKMG